MEKSLQDEPLASLCGVKVSFLVMVRFIEPLIRSKGIEVPRRIVLQVDSSEDVEALKAYFQNFDAAVDAHINDVKNSKCYVVSVYKNCKGKVLQLLEKEELSLILIVSGIVPSYLADCYIIQFDNQIINEEATFWDREIRKYMDYISKHPLLVLQELENFKTSKWYMEHKFMSSLDVSFHAVLEVYHAYYRRGHCETDTDEWVEILENGIEIIADEAEGIGYDMTQSIKTIVSRYLEDHSEIMFCDIEEVEGQVVKALECGQAILYDDLWYYFPERLFRTMFEPLRNTISIIDIKNRLFDEGYLGCDKGCTSGFTIKKVIVTTLGQWYRIRFLKIYRSFIVEDGSLAPEERRWVECTSDRSMENGSAIHQETLPMTQF